MITALLLSVMLAAGPGAKLRAGSQSIGSIQGSFGASTGVGVPTATILPPAGGQLISIHGEVTAGGANGGGTTLTLEVTAAGTSICSGTVSCTATGDFNIACSETFEAGQDLHLQIDSTGCGSQPVFLGTVTWYY